MPFKLESLTIPLSSPPCCSFPSAFCMCVAALHYSKMLSAGMWHEHPEMTATLPKQGTPQLCMHRPQTLHFIVCICTLICVCVCVTYTHFHLHVDPQWCIFCYLDTNMTPWLQAVKADTCCRRVIVLWTRDIKIKNKCLMQFKNKKNHSLPDTHIDAECCKPTR